MYIRIQVKHPRNRYCLHDYIQSMKSTLYVSTFNIISLYIISSSTTIIDYFHKANGVKSLSSSNCFCRLPFWCLGFPEGSLFPSFWNGLQNWLRLHIAFHCHLLFLQINIIWFYTWSWQEWTPIITTMLFKPISLT